jgi:hypothetical protein
MHSTARYMVHSTRGDTEMAAVILRLQGTPQDPPCYVLHSNYLHTQDSSSTRATHAAIIYCKRPLASPRPTRTLATLCTLQPQAPRRLVATAQRSDGTDLGEPRLLNAARCNGTTNGRIQWLYLAANGCKTYLNYHRNMSLTLILSHKCTSWGIHSKLAKPVLNQSHSCCGGSSTVPPAAVLLPPLTVLPAASTATASAS